MGCLSCRKVVIDLFCAKEPNAKLRKADIIEAAKIVLNREVGNIEYQKVSKNFLHRISSLVMNLACPLRLLCAIVVFLS